MNKTVFHMQLPRANEPETSCSGVASDYTACVLRTNVPVIGSIAAMTPLTHVSGSRFKASCQNWQDLHHVWSQTLAHVHKMTRKEYTHTQTSQSAVAVPENWIKFNTDNVKHTHTQIHHLVIVQKQNTHTVSPPRGMYVDESPLKGYYGSVSARVWVGQRWCYC